MANINVSKMGTVEGYSSLFGVVFKGIGQLYSQLIDSKIDLTRIIIEKTTGGFRVWKVADAFVPTLTLENDLEGQGSVGIESVVPEMADNSRTNYNFIKSDSTLIQKNGKDLADKASDYLEDRLASTSSPMAVFMDQKTNTMTFFGAFDFEGLSDAIEGAFGNPELVVELKGAAGKEPFS